MQRLDPTYKWLHRKSQTNHVSFVASNNTPRLLVTQSEFSVINQ